MYGRSERRQTNKTVCHFFERYKKGRESEKKQKNYKRSVSEEADKKHDKKAMIFFLWAQRGIPQSSESGLSLSGSVLVGGGIPEDAGGKGSIFLHEVDFFLEK